jgi:hypothetical protein
LFFQPQQHEEVREFLDDDSSPYFPHPVPTPSHCSHAAEIINRSAASGREILRKLARTNKNISTSAQK